MSKKKTNGKVVPETTMAAAFAVATNTLEAKIAEKVLEVREKVQDEALSDVLSALDSGLAGVDFESQIAEIDLAIEASDMQLIQSATVDVLTGMRRDLPRLMAERHANYAKWQSELRLRLDELETRREKEGWQIDRYPPNHPLVQRVRELRDVIRAAEAKALENLDLQIQLAAEEAKDALEYRRTFQSLWTAWHVERANAANAPKS